MIQIYTNNHQKINVDLTIIYKLIFFHVGKEIGIKFIVINHCLISHIKIQYLSIIYTLVSDFQLLERITKLKPICMKKIYISEIDGINDKLNYLREQYSLQGIIFEHSAQSINDLIQACNKADDEMKKNKNKDQNSALQQTINLIYSNRLQDATNKLKNVKFSDVDRQYLPMLMRILQKYFQMYEYLYPALIQIDKLRVNQDKQNKISQFMTQSESIRKGELKNYLKTDWMFIQDNSLTAYAKWVRAQGDKIKEKEQEPPSIGLREAQSGHAAQIKQQIKQNNERIVREYEKMLEDLTKQKQKFNEKKQKLITNLKNTKNSIQQLKMKYKQLLKFKQQIMTQLSKSMKIQASQTQKIIEIVSRNRSSKIKKQLKINQKVLTYQIFGKAQQPNIKQQHVPLLKKQIVDQKPKNNKKQQINRLKELINQTQKLRYNIRQEYQCYLKQKIQQLFNPASQKSLQKLITSSIRKYITQLPILTSSTTSITQPATQVQQQPGSSLIPFPSDRQGLFIHNLFLGFQTNSFAKPTKQYPKQREYLVQIVQSYAKKRIARTKLLFEHDTINLLNFHQYADDFDNYVVIVKLDNEMIIAGYSQCMLNEKVSNTGPGFISSLSNCKTLYINNSLPGSHTTKYDTYYLIFGNDQFRIQPNAKQVFSYLGYQYSYYRPKMPPKVILGKQGAETSQYVNLQIHKVIFEGEDQKNQMKVQQIKN